MTVEEAICRRRSIRKFQNRAVDKAALLRLVELARLYACGGNRQPLRFGIVTTPAKTAALTAQLRWAMYLPGYTVRPEDAPAAYLVLLCDETVCRSCGYETGAASTAIFLAAEEMGLSTCALGSFQDEALRGLLGLPEALRPELVIAVGYGEQESRAVRYEATAQYRQETDGTFCVPKRSVSEVLVYED